VLCRRVVEPDPSHKSFAPIRRQGVIVAVQGPGIPIEKIRSWTRQSPPQALVEGHISSKARAAISPLAKCVRLRSANALPSKTGPKDRGGDHISRYPDQAGIAFQRPRKYNSTSLRALSGESKVKAAKLFIGLQWGPIGNIWQRPLPSSTMRPMISSCSIHLSHQMCR
jgi:hypothetical protein